jgi:hypothetical protein
MYMMHHHSYNMHMSIPRNDFLNDLYAIDLLQHGPWSICLLTLPERSISLSHFFALTMNAFFISFVRFLPSPF